MCFVSMSFLLCSWKKNVPIESAKQRCESSTNPKIQGEASISTICDNIFPNIMILQDFIEHFTFWIFFGVANLWFKIIYVIILFHYYYLLDSCQSRKASLTGNHWYWFDTLPKCVSWWGNDLKKGGQFADSSTLHQRLHST